MTVVCTIGIVVSHFFAKMDVEGTVIKENKSNYYVDFSKTLTQKQWSFPDSTNGKKVVDKTLCVELGK